MTEGKYIYFEISIHALREEGDMMSSVFHPGMLSFLSTPSVRRATHGGKRTGHQQAISIHALREEGDAELALSDQIKAISIHALREEGDGQVPVRRV